MGAGIMYIICAVATWGAFFTAFLHLLIRTVFIDKNYRYVLYHFIVAFILLLILGHYASELTGIEIL